MFCKLLLIICRSRSYHEPLKSDGMDVLSRKKFSDETNKKIAWVTKMYCDWRIHREEDPNLESIDCDLDNIDTITIDSLNEAVCRFLTEVKKLDGSDFPGKMLYDIAICIQFHLELQGFSWKLLNQDMFKNIRFTVDNLMKLRVSQGIGISVRKAEILSSFDKDLMWNLGLLGMQNPEVLLDTVVFLVGKGFALRAGKEHRTLRAPPFNSQMQFMHDSDNNVFIRYTEDIGLKTNKRGLKHRKFQPKSVDIYPIEQVERCPVRIILKYLSLFPPNRNCKAYYLQPRKKYSPDNWYLDKPVGSNKLREVVKDLGKKAGLPGFYSNHSLHSTCATTLYQANVDEQLIQEITGHRSLAVRSYKRTCNSQRKAASQCIFSSQRA